MQGVAGGSAGLWAVGRLDGLGAVGCLGVSLTYQYPGVEVQVLRSWLRTIQQVLRSWLRTIQVLRSWVRCRLLLFFRDEGVESRPLTM